MVKNLHLSTGTTERTFEEMITIRCYRICTNLYVQNRTDERVRGATVRRLRLAQVSGFSRFDQLRIRKVIDAMYIVSVLPC